MGKLAFFKASFEPVWGNAESAIKCFAVVHPFLHKKLQHTEEKPFPDIVDVITDKVLRFGVLAVSKLWDNSKSAKSIPRLLLKMDSAFSGDAEFLTLRSEVRTIDQSDLVQRLRKFRNKFLAHNEGVNFDASMSFTPIELEELLLKTTRIVDGIQSILHGLNYDSELRYKSYAMDALYDWCELLQVSVPIDGNSDDNDAWLLGDGDN